MTKQKIHPDFNRIDQFRINNLPYIKDNSPLEEGDVCIDKRDLTWGVAEMVTDTHCAIRCSWVSEVGIPLEYVQRLKIKTVES